LNWRNIAPYRFFKPAPRLLSCFVASFCLNWREVSLQPIFSLWPRSEFFLLLSGSLPVSPDPPPPPHPPPRCRVDCTSFLDIRRFLFFCPLSLLIHMVYHFPPRFLTFRLTSAYGVETLLAVAPFTDVPDPAASSVGWFLQ